MPPALTFTERAASQFPPPNFRSSRRRLRAASLCAVALLLCAAAPAVAQTVKKRVVTVRGGDTQEGSRLILMADSPLDDYSSYAEGERVFVVIARSSLAGARSSARGRGFYDMRVEQKGEDVSISFMLRQGATVRIGQSFNRLELTFFTNEQSSAHQNPNR